jgi:hypothetical protein
MSKVNLIDLFKSHRLLTVLPYTLYVIEFYDLIFKDSFCKIGITEYNTQMRFNREEYNNLIIKNEYVVKGPKDLIRKQENENIHLFRRYRKTPRRRFSGRTECFKPDAYIEIEKKLKNDQLLILEHFNV